MLKIIILSTLLPTILFPLSSFATISNFAISGAASNYVRTSSGSGTSISYTHTMYGGVGSAIVANTMPCIAGETGTCNTCTNTTDYPTVAGQNNIACNPKAIGPDSTFTITFTSTVTGNAMMNTANNTSQIAFAGGGTTVAYTAGQTITLTYKWAQICDQLSDVTCAAATGNVSLNVGVAQSGTTLTDSQSITFYVGAIENVAVDTTSGGIEDVAMFPGDEKAYVRSLSSFSSFTSPGGSELSVSYLAIYYSEGTCAAAGGNEADALLNNGTFALLGLDANGLVLNKITGLRNNTEYLFKIAMQDIAGNIGLFTATPASAGGNSCIRYYQTVIPQTVYGLLNDGDNCFIATAAFGSLMDSRVQVFRDFRDKYLLTTNFGKKFVDFYYKNSPPLAHYISDKPVLRAITRAILYPVLGYTWVYLNVGSIPANLIFTFIIFGLFMLVRSRKTRKQI